MKVLLVLALLLLSTTPALAQEAEPVTAICTYNGLMPDPVCSPGWTDPRVTQDNLDSTICMSGYTATVRPRTSYTTPLKRLLMLEYGDIDTDGRLLPLSAFEMDHIISLELGGHPTDIRNFYPEHGLHNDKDKLENRMNDRVCDRTISLVGAQRAIATDWVVLYIYEFGVEPVD